MGVTLKYIIMMVTKGEMARTCSAYGRDEKCTQSFEDKLKVRERLQDTGVDREQNIEVKVK
jgi:hypothetical protein